LKEKDPSIDPNILNLPPIRLEILFDNYYKTGYHVPMPANFNFRLRMVELAEEKGISWAARVYGTTRKTVRKWIARYNQNGLEGLKDRKKIPKTIPHKMDKEDEKCIVELRKTHPSWGARMLKDRYKLKWSHMAIHRVIKQNGLIKKKKKRWQKRKDLRKIKEKMRPFEKAQIDTKDLSDIVNYYPLMVRFNLPKFEYTYRDMSTGASFYAYADANNSNLADLFARYVLEHLKSYGIDTASIIWQTDNGSEYIGNVNKKTDRLSAFEEVLNKHHVIYERIPPRCAHWQGDVESFHRIIENELYDIESYGNQEEFLGKAYAYQLYFNYFRSNRWRDNKTPEKILKEKDPSIDPNILNLPPIRLEILFDNYYKTGYHVPMPATFF
ncbi:MAG: helix-turn-helix domain-containing protein, partial [bacterium]|nr:helix-turn-helix domain-containing protein [bacterium]